MGRFRVFKPGDWYTNPERFSINGKCLWRVSKYEVRGRLDRRYVSLEFDHRIDREGNLIVDTKIQSNPYLDKEMVKVPKRVMKIILNKQPGYLNLLNLLL